MQLEFLCRRCGLKGLTPEVSAEEALLLARGELELRCPKCGLVLSMRTTESELINATETVAAELQRSFAEVVKRAIERYLAETDEDE